MFMNRLLSVSSSLLIAIILLLGHPVKAADAANGEKLFKANCGACHILGRPMTGPNLVGVSSRWEDKELLHTWIKNPGKAKATGDPYITQLLAEWEPKSGLMAAQAVSDAEIDDILAYIDNWAPPAPVQDQTTADTQGEGGVTYDENIMILSVILLILVLVLGLVLTIRARISKIIAAQEGLPDAEKPGPIKVLIDELKDFVVNQMNPTLLVLTVGGILSIFLVIDLYNRAQDLGLQQGYAPDQPIKFSHKLHAGQYGIDCQYCHTGVEKSKNANIPSSNICMNCHTVVQSGPKYGTEEISKIYAAIGYDATTGNYTGETKPVEWVRIHNLPDHVYFSHKQHVVAGNLDCENCHGNVREMEVVEQVSLLEMGWCINCHRETEVVIDNNYYQEHFHQVFEDDYAKYLEKNPDKKDEVKLGDFIKNHKKYTVSDMGGLECQRCHY
ncbi:c-type cytochrome [bacterium]|nr:c-type cytochrome [bacterium]